MSTADDLGPWEDVSWRHPDQRLAERVAEAFAWWLAQPAEIAPTSSITGDGAYAAVERELSVRHEGRPSLVVPSGTYALRLALASVGVSPGSEVVVPGLDWTASRDAVGSLGATPVPASVDPLTLTLDPQRVGALLSSRTQAVVVCHLHGVAADVAAVRQTVAEVLGREVPVVEDCAAALGSTLDGVPVGALGDAAAFSFGPGKLLSAEECGAVVLANEATRDVALRLAGHPLRWARSGFDPAAPIGGELPVRAHPVAAVLLAHRLAGWDAEDARERYAAHAAALTAEPTVERVVGLDDRRRSAQHLVPVISDGLGRPSGAVLLAPDPDLELGTVRLAGPGEMGVSPS